jgi:uncharacterized protein YndB with AHSA1/START domain
MSYTRPKTTDLTVTRLIPATPAEVYEVWLDHTSPGGPFFGSTKVIIDARVDGLFFTQLLHEGQSWVHYGRFVALEKPRLIEHTWISESTRGLESVVAISLEPEAGKTRVTLQHRGVPDDEMGRKHAEGWAYVLGCIEERFSKQK